MSSGKFVIGDYTIFQALTSGVTGDATNWYYGGTGSAAKIRYTGVTTNVTGSAYWGEDDATQGTPGSQSSSFTIPNTGSTGPSYTDFRKYIAVRYLKKNPSKSWDDAMTYANGVTYTFSSSGGTPSVGYLSFTDPYTNTTVNYRSDTTPTVSETYYGVAHPSNTGLLVTGKTKNFDLKGTS